MVRAIGVPPPLPHEHGAWVMLALPLVLGAVLAGATPSAAWLVPVTAVLAFLAQYALTPLAQRRIAGRPAPREWSRRRAAWGGIYLASAIASYAGAVLLAPSGSRAALLAISAVAAFGGAAYFAASCFGEARRITTELVGMAAVSLSAPVMAVASGRPAGADLVAAPLLAFAYSASALAFVRAYGRFRDARTPAALACVAAHAGIVAGLALASFAGWLSPWWIAAFAPVAARTAWGLTRPPENLRLLGLREVWVALSFTVIASAVVAA